MSFITKWFKQQKGKNKSSIGNVTSSDDDYVLSDEENLTISHSVLSFDSLEQIKQLQQKQQKQFEMLNIKELRESYEQQDQSTSNADSASNNSSTNANNNELDELNRIINLNKKDYESFKKSLNEKELDLTKKIEEKVNDIFKSEINLINKKNEIEMEIQLSSMRIAMEQTNSAYIEWINDECDKRIQLHLETNNELKNSLEKQRDDYEKQIDDLNNQINKLEYDLKTQKDSFKEDLDIALRSIENDISLRYDKTIDDKEEFIKQLESELENLKNLNQSVNTEFKDKEEKYLEHIKSLENLKSELIKTYNQEINQLKLLTKLNNETFLNDTNDIKIEVPSVTTNIPAFGGNTNESLCSNILVTLNQGDDINDNESNNLARILPTIFVSPNDTNTKNKSIDEPIDNSKRLKEANDELLMELKETLEDKERFIKELQYEIEEYKNDYENLKVKYDTSVNNTNNNINNNNNNNTMNNNDNFFNNTQNDNSLSENEFKELYLELKNEIESLSHPVITALRDELEDQFTKELEERMRVTELKMEEIERDYIEKIEKLSTDYESKINELNEYNQELKNELDNVLTENQKSLSEQETKHRHSIEVLEKQFENILNTELKKMRSASSESEKNEDDSQSLIADESLIQIDEINTDNDNSICDNINLYKSEPLENNNLDTSENKVISVTSSVDISRVQELNNRIKELEEQNQNLKKEMEKLYEKDDVFMASLRRQNEENDNFIKLLQSDIQSLTYERNSLLQTNNNLINVLSKTMVANTSIDDHINRRLAKILQMQQNLSNPKQTKASSKHPSRVTSPKNTLTGSTINSTSNSNQNIDTVLPAAAAADNVDTDSTGGEDLSDEGLDISQRLCDTFQNNFEVASEEVINDYIKQANHRLQSSIDKLLNMFEDTSKQLNEAHLLQSQLAEKLEENQNELDETKSKLINIENEHEEKLNDLIERLSHYEGLVEAYKNDMDKKQNEITNLEQKLETFSSELTMARNTIDTEKSELSNLENARRDLVEQRDFFTNQLDDSEFKVVSGINSTELLRNNSQLLDEKQDLEFKLKKSVEKSKTQIEELEQTIDTLNYQIRANKEEHENEVNEYKKQIEVMEATMRNDKSFVDSQFAEFEIKCDEYEAQIKKLTDLINRKENLISDNEDSAISKLKNESEEKIKEYERILEEQTDRLNRLLIDYSEIEKELTDKENENTQMSDLIDDLKQHVEEQNEKIENTEKKLAQSTNEIELLMQTLKKNNESLDNYKEKIALYEMNSENLKEDLQTLEKEKDDLMLEKNELLVQLHNQRSKVADLEIHKNDLESKFKIESSNLENKLKASEATILDKEAKIQKQIAEIYILKEELQNKIDAEEHKKNQMYETRTMSIDYEGQISRLNDENLILKKNIEDLTISIEKYKEDKNSINELTQQLIDNKNDEIDDLQSQIKLLQEDNEKYLMLESKYEALSDEKDDIEKSLNEKINLLENELNDFTKENENLVSLNKDLEEENEAYKQSVEEKVNELNKNELVLDDMNNKLKEYEASVETLQKELDEKIEESKALNDTVNQLSSQIKELKEKNDDLLELNENITLKNQNELKTKIDKVENEQQKEIENFKDKLKKLENELNSKEEECEELKYNNNVKENLIVDYENDLKKMRAIEINQIDELKRLEVEFENKIKDNLELINEKDTKIKTIQQNYENIKNQFDELQKERNDIEETNNLFREKVEKQINEYQYEIKRLLNENDEIKKSFNTQIQTLLSQLQNIKNESQTLTQKQQQDLEKKYLNEIKQLKESQSANMRNDQEINRLKEEHKQALESLRKDYEKLIRERTEQVRQEANEEAEKRIEEIKQQYEKDLNDLDRSTSPESSMSTMAFDLGQKLNDEIKLTQELDNRLIGALKKNSKSKNSTTTNDQNGVISNKLKQILEKVDKEGVLLLTLSELLQLKTHLNQKALSNNPNVMNKILNTSYENEKDQLLKQIYQLRELLAKVNDTTSVNTAKDWRGDLVRAVGNVFKEEQESLLAELRSFVTSNAHVDENKVVFFENKVKAQEQFLEKSMNNLMNADRQSLLNEVKYYKDENQKLQDDLRKIQEEERQFKRELQLMEYNKDAENIKANDLKQNLNSEKTKNLELMEKLNQERKKTNSMQEQLCDLKDEVGRMKDTISIENKNYKLICKELENEKARGDEMKSFIEHLKGKYKELEENQNIEKTRSSARRHANENQEIAHLRKVNSDLEQRFIELQRHANELEHLLVEEKTKRDAYIKELHDRSRDDRASVNLRNKFDQIQPSGYGSYADLERVRQTLEFIALKHKNEVDSVDPRYDPYSNSLKNCLDEIVDELHNMDLGPHGPITGMQEKLLKQNNELIDTIKKLNEEKLNLRNAIVKLENDVKQYKRKNDHVGTLSDVDKEKFKKLYYKYLRAESFRKSLIYQKRFLLIMLSGYEDTEREILATLKVDPKTFSTMSQPLINNNYHYNNDNNYYINNNNNNNISNKNSSFYSNKFLIHKARSRFRIAAHTVIAVYRIKFLIRKHAHILNRVDTNR